MPDLKKIIEDYFAAWRDGRTETLAAFWNPDVFKFYKAEEDRDVYHDWSRVLAYFKANETINEDILQGCENLTALPLEGPWTMGTFKMRWDLRFLPTAPGPLANKKMGGDNHVIFLLHEDKFAGWSETPDAPILYMRRLYEDQGRI